jgi:peroxiredoxin
MENQATFAENELFPYQLLSDPDQSVGAAYDAVRQEGEKGFGGSMPRRISYLISPEGNITKAYDLTGQDLTQHSAVVLADIAVVSS